MGTRAAVYGRQSKDNKISISDQLDLGRQRAGDEEWEVSFVFEDGESASRHTTRGRDDWARLLAVVEERAVDVVWLWEASRGDRKASSWLAFLELCREHDVDLCIENDERPPYKLSVARDWKIMAAEGIDSHYESELVHQRTLRAKNQARRRGDIKSVYGGPARFGWRDPGKGHQWVVDKAAAAVLAEVAQRRLRGEGLVSIHADLTRRGVLIDSYGEAVSYKRLGNVLRSPIVAGLAVNRDGSVAGGAEGPLDLATWYRLEALRASGTERGAVVADAYPLGRVLTCGKCGNQLTGSTEGRGGTRIRVYRCHTPHPATGHDRGCRGTQIRADVVHAVIEEALAQWARSPRAKALGAQAFDGSARRAELTTQWSLLQERMSGLEGKRDRGRITPVQFSQHEKVIEDDFARIEAELAALDVAETKPVPLDIEWADMTPGEKCALVESIFVTPIRVRTQPEVGSRDQRERLSGLTLRR